MLRGGKGGDHLPHRVTHPAKLVEVPKKGTFRDAWRVLVRLGEGGARVRADPAETPPPKKD